MSNELPLVFELLLLGSLIAVAALILSVRRKTPRQRSGHGADPLPPSVRYMTKADLVARPSRGQAPDDHQRSAR